jgi:hypothetical protein
MIGRPILLGVLATVAVAGCVGAGDDGPAQVSLALELDASPDAVRLLGLYAFAADLPGLSCEEYESGTFDPFEAFSEEDLAGITFFGIAALEEGTQRFDGITPGSRFILVEGYEGSGARLFLGCAGPTAIDPGKTAHVSMTMVPDPELVAAGE